MGKVCWFWRKLFRNEIFWKKCSL